MIKKNKRIVAIIGYYRQIDSDGGTYCWKKVPKTKRKKWENTGFYFALYGKRLY